MKGSDSPGDSRFPLTKNAPKTQPQAAPAERRSRSSQARPRTFGYYAKWTIISLFCLFSASVGAITGSFYLRSPWIRDFLNGVISNPSKTIQIIKSGDPLAGYTPDQYFPSQQHSLNVLVLGCDSDYYEDRPEPIKGKPGRSDAIMAAHLDFDKNTISILSIPRDTAAPIPGYKGFHKINAAHSWGGNDLSTETIREDFGINPDYTVSLDFDSFQKVVDAVGGVDLTVDKKLDYDDNWANLHIHLKPGYQHLNGYHAMGFVRIRHTDDDLHRAARQHEFIEAVRKKIVDPKNLFKLPDVLNAITEDIKSNMTREQMLTLVHWVSKLHGENVQLDTLPSSEDRIYVYADPVKGAELVGKIFYAGDPNAVTLHVASRTSMIAMNSRAYGERRLRRRAVRHRLHNEPAALNSSAGELDPSLSNDDSLNAKGGIDYSSGGDRSAADGTDSSRSDSGISTGTNESGTKDHNNAGTAEPAKSHHNKPDSNSGSASPSDGGSGTGSGKSGGDKNPADNTETGMG